MQERDLVGQLVECIKHQSENPPGHVHTIVHWLKQWAYQFGAEIERQKVETNKENVVITLDLGPGPSLVFNTHMDVNNPSGQKWSFSPTEPKISEDRVYGLGACDAKGSLVSMMCAMEDIAFHPEGLCGKLILTAVMGEEAGGIGSLHLVQEGITADAAVVGEPTNGNIAVAHKGTYMKKLTFKGIPYHSGTPGKGVNAIHHAAHFIGKIEKLNERLSAMPHFALGPPSAAVTIIQGGTRQNTIPETCEIILDRRLLPGETHEQADREVDTIIHQLKKEVKHFNVEVIETIVATVPSETDTKEKIVQKSLEAAAEIEGVEKEAIGFPAGCDMSKLVTHAKIPTVICGPGKLEQAHKPDEYVEISQLFKAKAIYASIAKKVLKSSG
ncbi:M20 family metallopeptidase [Salibacterium aidingense]|uniref:M20 family metallopeptidase n=1 Tax=Salibacterium aidingense TaxID=384933 RepID=UPI003BE7AB4C